METEITSRTGKKYLLKPNKNGGWKVIRKETGSEETILGTQFGLAAFARFVSVDDRFSKIPDARNYFSQFYDADGNFTGIPSQ